ncbi:dTDP-4-dehydrorhamnose 3,5-epimerase [Geomonas sp. Red32]|uniref:dTDP-4-dehydrorhamnose 3,5-epimerase n=1 Tax=Geomonas sp. Red32 TaxID=2912856 RepID=UPI00202D0DA1|nr:dTDP-4-dehydrorhamnose 3,5-epimerase [Geomonas sp. Red32]
MKFRPAGIAGAFLVEIERQEDERGFFARSWCAREFEEQGLNPRMVQCNISFNAARGTLRGMHYQIAPFEEVKLVRCTMGSIYDVIVDLREDSPTYRRHFGVELNPRRRNMLYVPEGAAHGFLTLEDNSEVFYQMSQFYTPGSARGIRWDDPLFGIEWPGEVRVVCERDRRYPGYARSAP